MDIYCKQDDIELIDKMRRELANRKFVCLDVAKLLGVHTNVASAFLKRCYDLDIVDEYLETDIFGKIINNTGKTYFVTKEAETAILKDVDDKPADEPKLFDLNEKKFTTERKCLWCRKAFTATSFGKWFCDEHSLINKQDDFYHDVSDISWQENPGIEWDSFK
jgi:hypothetical protein